jgi:hypothetical protein
MSVVLSRVGRPVSFKSRPVSRPVQVPSPIGLLRWDRIAGALLALAWPWP